MWKWEAEGQPKAVVAILHSAYEQHHWYAWLIERFRSAGFHVVMGDLPGHGKQGQYLRYH
ncbi:MAG: alpha/beta hydrolase, partial [Solibacillus sp.]